MMELVRVICLIPSMTETLIECGINVVGRTRYCIHPKHKVNSIPILGGTKIINAAELMAQKPDLVILDKEENTKETGELLISLGCQIHVMHVRSLPDLAQELLQFADILNEVKFKELHLRIENILRHRGKHDFRRNFLKVSQYPRQGFYDDPLTLILPTVPKKVNYVIWKKPWMVIGRGTFIDDVLSFAGFELAHDLIEKYPQLTDLDQNVFHFFSSEPYPFLREWEDLKNQCPHSLLVDGEKISWFGIRSICFLEAVVELPQE
jgi:hypothetical protein